MKTGKKIGVKTSKKTGVKTAKNAGAKIAPWLSFRDIVESIPDDVVAFFQKFESSRDRLTLTQEADVLNTVAHEEYLDCAGTGGKSGRRPTALMRWYEVFRDIYILSRARSSNDAEIRKNPNGFATFARTFAPFASCVIL